MKVKEVQALIQAFAPYELQADFDNSGLNVGEPEMEVSACLLCVDVSKKVIDEAVSKKCNLIISHHPIIFRPLHNITADDYVGGVVLYAIQKGIALLSAHTNVDKCDGGINDSLALLLGGTKIYRLPQVDEYAVFFEIPTISVFDYSRKVASLLSDGVVGCIGGDSLVSRAAVVGGAGGEYQLVRYCIQNSCVLITSEVKNHIARMIFDEGGYLISCGHFTSEHIFITIIKRLIADKVTVYESEDKYPFGAAGGKE